MMSKNSIVPFLKDYLIKFLTRPFLLDTNDPEYEIRNRIDFDKPLCTYARRVTELFHVQDLIILTQGHKQKQRM